MICPTPPDWLTDGNGRPYFLWDVPRITIEQFRAELRDPDPEVRAYWLGKAMREAKPDDVFLFATTKDIVLLWPLLQKHLGREKRFWTWLLERWRKIGYLAA